ncbi:MAG: hypothetical protein C4547_00960 [Phycisphaerales bacterium]|nr:MAG: hypothetical protein C4547_00960 [Phycisphaerales bacterium]
MEGWVVGRLRSRWIRGREAARRRSTSTSRTAPTITHLSRHGTDAKRPCRPSALQSPGLRQACPPQPALR